MCPHSDKGDLTLLSPFLRFFRWFFLSREELHQNRGAFLLCLVSGLSGGLLFRHTPLGLLAWVALMPYFLALGRFTTPRAMVYGTYLFGFVWYYLNLWWLHTLTVFSTLIPLGVPALALIQSTYFLAFAFPARFALRRLPAAAAPWLLALMWPGMEYLRTWTDLAFPWNYFGHSQVMLRENRPVFLELLQVANIAGVYAVSGLLVLTNALLAVLVSHYVKRTWSRGLGLSTLFVTLLLVGSSVYGLLNVSRGAGPLAPSSIKIASIQPGISQVEKWNAMMGVPGDTQEQAATRYQEMELRMKGAAETLLRQAHSEQPSLYLMPESAFFSGYFTYDTVLHKRLHLLSQELGGDLFFGADNRIPKSEYEALLTAPARAGDAPLTMTLPIMPTRLDDSGTTVPDWEKEPAMIPMVAAWHVTPERGLSDVVYNKVQLVPFGEMIPLVNGIDWLRNKLEAAGIAGAFKPGFGYTTFETSGTKYGAVICFESSFPHLTSGLTKAGAQFLCVLTNDAWYDPNYLMEQGGFWGSLFRVPVLRGLAASGPYQHYAHSIYRAIETRRPLVRTANTGISAVIDRDGRVLQDLSYGSSGHLVAEVPNYQQHLTWYVRFGDWFAALGLAVLGAMCVWQFGARRKHN